MEKNFIIIIISVMLNAVAQIMLKFGAKIINSTQSNMIYDKVISAINIPIFIGLICYLFSLVIWVYALTKVDVSIAYPMLSFGYVVVALLSYFLFGESISPLKVIAMLIIMFGVFLIFIS